MDRALIERRSEFWPSTVDGSGSSLSGTPNVVPSLQARPVLVPLERLGAQQGYSGASVFIAYYMDEAGTYLPSKPVVIKIGRRSKLEEEFRAAAEWPRHFSGEDGRFASPFLLCGPKSPTSNLAVLLAPFSSEGALNARQTGWQLRVNDLWVLLHERTEQPRNLLKHITNLYDLLYGVHRDGRVVCDRSNSYTPRSTDGIFEDCIAMEKQYLLYSLVQMGGRVLLEPSGRIRSESSTECSPCRPSRAHAAQFTATYTLRMLCWTTNSGRT